MMDHSLRFFLSYSLSKAIRSGSVRTFVDVVQQVVEKKFHGSIVDPMQGPPAISIQGDVIQSLQRCDCLIAETTNASVNVYYEIGFANALAKPVIIFLDEDRNDHTSPTANADMRDIRLRVFGHTHPADLGDIRYVPYRLPDNPRSNEIEELERAVSTSIESALKSLLPPELVQPARSVRRTFTTSRKLMEQYINQPSKLWLIDGLSSYTERYYTQLANSRMQVDESLYEAMLAAMPASMRSTALAIADITDEFEPFLLTTPDIKAVSVRKRIFAFDGAAAFTSDFEKLVANIWRHAREYSCLMVDREFAVRMLEESGLKHELGSRGTNVMSTGRSAVWYSPPASGAEITSRMLLTIDNNEHLAGRIERLFDRIAEQSVDITALAMGEEKRRTSLQRARTVKAEWLRLRGLGQWDSDWTSHLKRADKYYRDYEYHIRAWIPDYDRMVLRFIEHVTQGILEASNKGWVRVVEVGPGTGEITERLVREIARTHTEVVSDYVLVEDAEQMLYRMSRRGLVAKQYHRFKEVQFPPDADQRVRVCAQNACFLRAVELDNRESPTVLIGSLVHHYIDVLDHEEPSFREFLIELKDRIPGVAQIVFAGMFFSGDVAQQVRAWRDWMVKESGLEEEAVERFFAGNPEMQRHFSVKTIRADAEAEGFAPEFSTTNAQRPFGVLHLRRVNS